MADGQPDLQINYDQLHKLANDARTLKDNLDNEVPGLSTGISGVRKRSEAIGSQKLSSSLIKFHTAWEQPFKDAMDRLGDLAGLLDGVATKFFDMDSDFATKSSSSLASLILAQWQGKKDEWDRYQATKDLKFTPSPLWDEHGNKVQGEAVPLIPWGTIPEDPAPAHPHRRPVDLQRAAQGQQERLGPGLRRQSGQDRQPVRRVRPAHLADLEEHLAGGSGLRDHDHLQVRGRQRAAQLDQHHAEARGRLHRDDRDQVHLRLRRSDHLVRQRQQVRRPGRRRQRQHVDDHDHPDPRRPGQRHRVHRGQCRGRQGDQGRGHQQQDPRRHRHRRQDRQRRQGDDRRGRHGAQVEGQRRHRRLDPDRGPRPLRGRGRLTRGGSRPCPSLSLSAR